MINVAFYLTKNINSDIDTSNILKGNPGIGGTEYLTLYLMLSLSKNNNYNVILYTENILFNLPKSISQIKVKSFFESSIKNKYNNLVYIISPFQLQSLKPIESLNPNINYILWSHINFNYLKNVMKLASSNPIKKCVMLTKQSTAYYPLSIRKKTIIIGHPSPYVDLNVSRSFNKNVLLLGALVPLRKADNLLSIWKQVLQKNPTAHLYICGSGNLYDRTIMLGKNGIAEKEYETKLFTIIEKNKIKDSITFLGNVSIKDNVELLKSIAVGVTNPRYEGYETFCLSAIELGSFKIPVIAGDIDGLKKTLPRKCGYRVKSNKELLKKINILLIDKRKNINYGNNYYSFIKKKYNPTIFLQSWEYIIDNIFSNRTNILRLFCFKRFSYLIIRIGKKIISKTKSLININK